MDLIKKIGGVVLLLVVAFVAYLFGVENKQVQSNNQAVPANQTQAQSDGLAQLISQVQSNNQTAPKKPVFPSVLCDGMPQKCGYFTADGTMLIKPQFNEAYGFTDNGLARIKLNEKYGYINSQGEWVIQPQFDNAMDFADNGLARAEVNGKWGYINAQGAWAIQPQFDTYVMDFSDNGLAQVGIEYIKYGYINTQGIWVIPPELKDPTFMPSAVVELPFNNGLARAEINNEWGYINAQGKWVIQPQFEGAWDFAYGGLASVKLNGKWGYINTKGEWVIQPQFDGTWGFANSGLAQAKLNDKWGHINTQGTWVIQPQFDWVASFDDDVLVQAYLNDKYGYINAQGKWIIPPQFDDAEKFARNGLAKVKLNGDWMLINNQGQVVVTWDTVCDTNVLKDKNGKVFWPSDSVVDICAEASYRRSKKISKSTINKLINAMSLNNKKNGRVGDSGKAIQAFIKEGYLKSSPNKRFDYTDYWQIQGSVTFMGHQLVAIEEEYMAAYIGCCVDPGIGITVKLMEDVSKLQKFADINKCSLTIYSKSEFNTYEKEYMGFGVVDEGKYATLSCRSWDINRAS